MNNGNTYVCPRCKHGEMKAFDECPRCGESFSDYYSEETARRIREMNAIGKVAHMTPKQINQVGKDLTHTVGEVAAEIAALRAGQRQARIWAEEVIALSLRLVIEVSRLPQDCPTAEVDKLTNDIWYAARKI